MEHSIEYQFFMSQFSHIEDIKDTEKTKISAVYHKEFKTSCILRVCNGRDLSAVYGKLRSIRNPNTVVVHDFVYENGDTYILEECVDGSTVQELLEYDGTISEQKTARIIIEICKALEVLHNEKPPIVHNDINPSNIKIREDGSVKLFDFDISRTYKKGQNQNTVLFGTEEFAAPEHFGYGQSEPRTDIYCLGVTMHKMLTGQSLSSEHRSAYTGKLKKIINKCLEFDPKNRYASVSELKNDLEKFSGKKHHAFRNALFAIGLIAVIAGALLLFNESGKNGTPDITEGTEPGTSQNDTTVEGTQGSTENKTEITSEAADNQHSTEEEQNSSSRETAKALVLAQKQSGAVSGADSDDADWYKFSTAGKAFDYRIEIFATNYETVGNMSLYVAIFDSLGIKTEAFMIQTDNEYGFLDLYLPPDTEYFLKVYASGRMDTAEYDICVTDRGRDAGADKENAIEIVLGTMYSTSLTSTLSNWHVFYAPDYGIYRYTINNIDVGCDIDFSLINEDDYYADGSVPNEDNYSGEFSANYGDSIYFEIHSSTATPVAKGNYIITVEQIY